MKIQKLRKRSMKKLVKEIAVILNKKNKAETVLKKLNYLYKLNRKEFNRAFSIYVLTLIERL